MNNQISFQHFWKRVLFLGLAAVLILAVSAPGSTAKAISFGSSDQIQYGTEGVGNNEQVLSSGILRWQEFKPNFDNISWVNIDFLKTGTPGGTVTIEIKDKTGGTSLGSKTYTEAEILTGWKNVFFPSTINLTPGEIYRIYVYSTGATVDISNYIAWQGNDASTSTYSCSPVDCQTDVYGSNSSFDYRFQTWGDAAIFSDGFESGNLSAWSRKVGASTSDSSFGTEALCNLCVRMKGALVDSYSLKVRIPDKNPHFVKDSSPIWVKNYHASFQIKVGNTLKMDHLNKFTVFQGKQGKKSPFLVQIRKKGTQFQIRGLIRTDGGTFQKTVWTELPRESTKVDVKWEAASFAGANDGLLEISINDFAVGFIYNVDNDSLHVKFVRLGITAPIKARYNIYGTFKLDAFFSEAISNWAS